jgi:superoxide reductase
MTGQSLHRSLLPINLVSCDFRKNQEDIMDKRSFIRFGLIGTSLGIITPKAVFAAAMDTGLQSKLAGGVYHTEDAFGRWNKGVAEHHLPALEKKVAGGAAHLHVATNHPMIPYAHYIIKHELLNAEFRYMQEHPYDPNKNKAPVATFDVGNYRGIVYVMTICNVHDLWLNMIEV